MRKHALHEFVITVPSCVQTTSLSSVLEMFLGCDRLVVVSEQQYPIGVLYASRLIPQLMSSYVSAWTLSNRFNADLIQLNRLKDEFLACISHELKTPITTVMGLSTLLKDQSLGRLNERQTRYARLIHQSGRHLMSVVDDILDLTRMETGQIELTPEPIKIATVCDRAIKQATIQSKAAEPLKESFHNRFTLIIEPGLDILVADELRLRQMLINLLSNAFKFTEALEKARRLQPGAIFLNPLLPLLSGWDVLTLLKSDVATRHIPIIVTATRAEKDQAFSNRADEFLSLPVQQQTLQHALARFWVQPSSQSVLKIATGLNWKPHLLIVNVATNLHSSSPARGDWLQALVQYLQSAGFKGTMSHSCAEVWQQIQQQSVDLLLICLRDSGLEQGIIQRLMVLSQQHSLPPVVVLDQRTSSQSDAVEPLENDLEAIASSILPPSISIEELLDQIHQTLA